MKSSPEVTAYIAKFPPPVQVRVRKAVTRYAGPKGNLKFSHDDPLPLALIARIVRFKVKQDRARAAHKKSRK